MTGHLAVEAERLKRVFTVRGPGRPAEKIAALDEVTLSVRRGELFGLLGVNGAGKSTLLQILAAQLRPTSGTAKVAGFDVCRYAAHVRQHAGLVNGDEMPVMRVLAPSMSTGQRRRVALVRALVEAPKVLLLDQPTLGLDCAAARKARVSIRMWVDDDATRTVVLATNDLREAELCDRVAILAAGRIVACDAPSALAEQWKPQAEDDAEDKRSAAAALESAFLNIVGREAWARA